MTIKTATLQAINPKNQSKVNKAIQWMQKYEDANTKRDMICDNLECDEEDSKEYRAINRRCEQAFDKYLEAMEELPKGQQKAIEKAIG